MAVSLTLPPVWEGILELNSTALRAKDGIPHHLSLYNKAGDVRFLNPIDASAWVVLDSVPAWNSSKPMSAGR